MSHSSSAAEESSAPEELEKTSVRDFLGLEFGGNLGKKQGFIVEDFGENNVVSTLMNLDTEMVDIVFEFLFIYFE